MRKIKINKPKAHKKQMPFMVTCIDHPHAAELKGISDIIDDNFIIYKWSLQDLTGHPDSTRDVPKSIDLIDDGEI